MMTLREFLERVNTNEHYRVYQPNRDCLIFESYFKVHSPYHFNKLYDEDWFQSEYYENNDYCDDVRKFKPFDKETMQFLDRFGDYIVMSIEISSFHPMKVEKINGELKFDHYDDIDSCLCFNLFIIPQH